MYPVLNTILRKYLGPDLPKGSYTHTLLHYCHHLVAIVTFAVIHKSTRLSHVKL